MNVKSLTELEPSNRDQKLLDDGDDDDGVCVYVCGVCVCGGGVCVCVGGVGGGGGGVWSPLCLNCETIN